MPIDLREFASGDTDYIAKMNANVATLENFLSQLETQVAAIAGTNQLSVGMFFDSLFNHADALIGPGSYLPTPSGTTLNIAAGGAFLQEEQTVVSSFITTPLGFIGVAVGTWYIVVTTSGAPTKNEEQLSGSMYSVYWNGSSFSAITRLVPVFYDTVEAEASRDRTSISAVKFTTLDARLESGETATAGAVAAAAVAVTKANQALNAVAALDAELGLAATFATRKVGCSIDGTTGVKGAIQVDFIGTIIGWSVIADVAGTLQVEVDKIASSAPPAAPAIPNTSTDKISASAPVALTAAQSASSAEAGVSTWSLAVAKWDVIQFNVVTVSTLTRATLYLRIRETPPDVVMVTGHIASTAQVDVSYGPFSVA
jgi:hypothetical protein